MLALLIMITSPTAFTKLCGTITPFAPPRTLDKADDLVALTLQPKTLLRVIIASSISPK